MSIHFGAGRRRKKDASSKQQALKYEREEGQIGVVARSVPVSGFYFVYEKGKRLPGSRYADDLPLKALLFGVLLL